MSNKTFGYFDDATNEYVITNPLTPFPWINYLSNTRLTAFISQQAGGLAFYREAQTRRISRYHYLSAPQDRPGFYLYVNDQSTGTLWNPHVAPVNTALDSYECRHAPGYTRFISTKDGTVVNACYFIPPNDDIMLWDVSVANSSNAPKEMAITSYLEFGLLEFMREFFWCYLKNQIAFEYSEAHQWIKYIYHVFQAPYAPAIFFACSEKPDGYECSRDTFCGPGGSLERPLSLINNNLSGSQLPGGGHGCGVMSKMFSLMPQETKRCTFMLGIRDTWDQAALLKQKFSSNKAIDTAFDELTDYWRSKQSVFSVSSGNAHVDRMVNIWNPLNCQISLERTRDISTDHMGLDGMRYRDTMQDALAVATFNPVFAQERIELVFASQAQNGEGCFAFYPYSPDKKINREPLRCDNTVWPIFTVDNLVNETGNTSFFEKTISFRDGGSATIYDHILLGLHYIFDRRGPHGLPILLHADWNDSLAIFHDDQAESVMLGMQMVYAAKIFAGWARHFKRQADAEWCNMVIDTFDKALNADGIWDGEWYSRLLLKNGMRIGSSSRPQGKIYLEPQVWSVIAGIGPDGRAAQALQSATTMLTTRRGLMIHTPPYTGIPNPEDPLTSNVPGTGENGGIFCHANTWAIIAKCLLGDGKGAFDLYQKMLPSVSSDQEGQDHFCREPYAFTSTVVGPARGGDFGNAGISWLTGTASWMYIAATQYILGIKPTLAGLTINPCLPKEMPNISIKRIFRGKTYAINIRECGDVITVNDRSVKRNEVVE